jgi:hypothetical protein
MSQVTLILTRTPMQEFRYSGRSGRWGRMLVVEGPKVLSARFLPAAQAVAAGFASVVPGYVPVAGLAPAAASRACPASAPPNGNTVPFADRALRLATDGGAIKRLTEFDTMERFRADDGKGFYMQVKPRPHKPYPLTMMTAGLVAKLNKTGHCLRVDDHGYVQQGTNQTAGILVHEAPHVGWLIGCIAPREKNKRIPNNDRGPSQRAMDFIFRAMGGFREGKMASLIVLDW